MTATAPPTRPGKVHMTPAGYRRLEAERAALRADRHKIVAIVSWAASNGDRSENADYKEGKRRLREIDRRLGFIAQRLEDAEIVDPARQTQRDRVFFGATVSYVTQSDQDVTVTIVGVDEASMAEATVSIASPVARALLRARCGDEVVVQTPRGPETIEIRSIHYPDPS
ncbi:transcription elongation factor GreB [Acidiphilium sp.]|uniref:transcription elongation factor GreB n=1 Tax=Acidiphilium sp. TaxID=527 RepID=UPI003D06676F